MYKGYKEKPSEEEQECIDKLNLIQRCVLTLRAIAHSPEKVADELNNEIRKVLQEKNILCTLYYCQNRKELKPEIDACRKKFENLNNAVVYLVNKYPEIVGE